MRSLIKHAVVWYLSRFARAQLSKNRAEFIAVGGSSGKTSTASAIVTALSTTRRVKSGVGLNSDTGVPLAILGISMTGYGAAGWLRAMVLAPIRVLTRWEKYDAYVAEYGIDHPGDMARLLRIRVPDVAVLTNVALEHAGYFEGTLEEVMDQIAAEEFQLIDAVPQTGIAIACTDDPRVADRMKDVSARAVKVASHEGVDYELMRYRVSPEATEFDIFTHGVTYPVRLHQTLSRASCMSITLAAAAAHQSGVPMREALMAIAKSWHVPAGRGRVLRGREGRLLIDSSYNATPAAVSDALALLKDVAGSRRRVAILGDMRELGDHAPEAHRKLAHAVSGSADLAVLVGPAMVSYLKPELEDLGVEVRGFARAVDLMPELEGFLEAGDAVLIKGSQNTLFLERVTEELLEDRGDSEHLARRGSRWDDARAEAV